MVKSHRPAETKHQIVTEYSEGSFRFIGDLIKRSLLQLYDFLRISKLEFGCQICSSACQLKLREPDVIHNMVLRIFSGTFNA